MSNELAQLRTHLAGLPSGRIEDESKIESLLAPCWSELSIDEGGGMDALKLHGRMDNAEWNPPDLTFQIERHGGLVQGSSRAELQNWRVDLEKGTATLVRTGYRQLYRMAPRLDVKPIAREISELILSNKKDERLKWYDDGRVRVEIGKVIPDWAAKQTTTGRRKRFRTELNRLLDRHGWAPTRGANTYARDS